MIKRKICKIKGCKNLVGLYGLNSKGIKTYRTKCIKHHRLNSRGSKMRYSIPNVKCEVCKFDKCYCDRHRIIPSLGYKKDNVRILCPNCHRLLTLGLIK